MPRYYGWIKSTQELTHKHRFLGLQIPEIIDLSPFKPPVINQGNVGRCVGCGVAAQLSTTLTQLGDNPSDAFFWSPDDIYNGARVIEGTLDEDAGANAVDAYTWVKSYGVIKYVDWPLSSRLSTENPMNESAEAIMLPDFHRVELDNSVDGALASILDAMAQGHTIAVGASYFSQWENYSGGMQPTLSANSPIAGGHEEVFYYADSKQKYLKRQNSWGTKDFGQDNPGTDKGCEYISFDQIPILASMGIDLHYATFTAPFVPPTPPPVPPPTPPIPPKKKCFLSGWFKTDRLTDTQVRKIRSNLKVGIYTTEF